MIICLFISNINKYIKYFNRFASGSDTTVRDRSKRLLGLSQSTYIDKVLNRFAMQNSKKGFLPISHGVSLSKALCPSTKEERERMDKIPYASAIGSIMYAMICTRPDVSYALSMTSRY